MKIRLAGVAGVALLVVLSEAGLTPAKPPVVAQQAMVQASNGAIRDSFGRSVAVAGDTVVVGAEFHKLVMHAGQGAAYVFSKPRSGWANATQSATLIASDGRGGDLFGETVATDGDTIVVAAPFHRVGGHARQGEICVFTKPPNGWSGTLTENARLTTTDGSADDYLGGALAISGDTIVAGAYPHRVGKHPQQGKVYVFVKAHSGWAGTHTQTGSLVALNGAAGDWFGWSVSVSAQTIVAGAPLRTVGSRQHQGEAYVFLRSSSDWKGKHTENARLVASDGKPHDGLGGTVAVAGDTVVAGAPQRQVGRHPYQGMLYVFTRPRSGWTATRTQTGNLFASDGFGQVANGDVFGDQLGGFSLAISGDTIVSGSASHTVGKALDEGEAYVFVRPRSGWRGGHTESTRLNAANGHAGDWFGLSVAVSRSTTVVGAPDHIPLNPLTPGPGAAYVFIRDVGAS